MKFTKIAFLIHCYLALNTSYAFDVYGHRGARGLAPENTLPAYAKALQLGVDYVDMDVTMTKDHQLVVQHDLKLNSNITRNAAQQWITETPLIHDLALKQLQTYDVGRIKPGTPYAAYFPAQTPADKTKIPTLETTIQYVKIHAPTMSFQIEIKSDPFHPDLTDPPDVLAKAVASILERENIVARTQVQSFDWRVLTALQAINPKIHTAYLTDIDYEKYFTHPNPKIAGFLTGGKLLKDYDHSFPKLIHALGGQYWDPEDREVTKEQLKIAHDLGMKVVTWTLTENFGGDIDLAETKRMIQLGVDGIITDRPDLVIPLKHKV